MKIKIEKLPHGDVKIDLTTDTSKKPMSHTFSQTELATLLSMLDMARRVDRFTFELDYPK